MKLLIVTQKVDQNDDVLGFMHGWIEEFARQVSKVTVVCLQAGQYNLPGNAKVLSLGKETRQSKLLYLLNFYTYIWRERKNYDSVFVHMNHEYVILGGWLWRLWGKKVALWYAHGHVPLGLGLAERLSNVVFTSTPLGFRLRSRKVLVVGQGIDVDLFRDVGEKLQGDTFTVLTVGRISPVKGYETLIGAVEILKKGGAELNVNVIGGAGTPAQVEYLDNLKEQVKNKKLENYIKFSGPISNLQVPRHLQEADLFVNMSRTGSLDKAAAEAMAAGLPVLTCNESVAQALGPKHQNLVYQIGSASQLAEKIKDIMTMPADSRVQLGAKLRDIVLKHHSLNAFIAKVVEVLKSL